MYMGTGYGLAGGIEHLYGDGRHADLANAGLGLFTPSGVWLIPLVMNRGGREFVYGDVGAVIEQFNAANKDRLRIVAKAETDARFSWSIVLYGLERKGELLPLFSTMDLKLCRLCIGSASSLKDELGSSFACIERTGVKDAQQNIPFMHRGDGGDDDLGVPRVLGF